SSMLVARRIVDELVEFSGETELRLVALAYLICIAHLHVMIFEMEAMTDRLEVYDSLMCLKESKEAENSKVKALDGMTAQTEQVIRMKEGHVKVMEEAIRFG
ncbi:hypothetical protein Tco_1020843, partial [Tanacetum coccineum]